MWIIVGAGAQGRIVLDILRASSPLEPVAFLDDDPALEGSFVTGAEVHQRDWFQRRKLIADAQVVVAIGRNDSRLQVARELELLDAHFAILQHPSAVILPSAKIEPGAMLHPLSFVGSNALVGAHALVNTGTIVEHDCVIGAGSSLSPGVRMAGRVRVGERAFLGVGAVLNPRTTIGAGAIIGAGSVVTCDIPPDVVAWGAPARIMRAVDPEHDWQRLL